MYEKEMEEIHKKVDRFLGELTFLEWYERQTRKIPVLIYFVTDIDTNKTWLRFELKKEER